MTTNRFVEILDDIALFDSSAGRCAPYSGRGMFGKQCVSVSIDSGGYGLVAQAMIQAEEDEREELASIFAGTRWDDMGLGMVLYWPQMKWDDSLGEGL